jgi:hypothetical protein
MRILLAFRVFFQALFSAAAAEQFEQVIQHRALPAPSQSPDRAGASPPKAAVPPAEVGRAADRSEALSLLAALQREARFIDLVKEPLENYPDAQIGAAAREVLRDCDSVLERMFGLKALSDSDEGSDVAIPAGYHPLFYRLTGNVAGEPPYRGKLVHPGWIATRCELPAWTGDAEAARIVAPQEVELG